MLLQSLQLKKELTQQDYYGTHPKRQQLFEALHQLLGRHIDEQYQKSISLQKKLVAQKTCILYFLLQPNVPPDNNGSERAIRNIKVKQKISGQYKSNHGADIFAVLRSVIDTTIKSGQNVLAIIANLEY